MRNHKSVFGIFSPVIISNNIYTDMLSNIFLKTNSGLLGVKRHTDSKDLIYSRNIEYGKYLFLNPFFCSYLSIVL